MGISLLSLFNERVVLFQPRSFDKRHFISHPRSFLIKASSSASLRRESRFRFRVVRRDVRALTKRPTRVNSRLALKATEILLRRPVNRSLSAPIQ